MEGLEGTDSLLLLLESKLVPNLQLDLAVEVGLNGPDVSRELVLEKGLSMEAEVDIGGLELA